MKREFDPTKIKKVNIELVKPNPWNPKEKDTIHFEKVLKSVEENGIMGAVAVREVNGGYEIIDGEQRYTAGTKLGYKEIYIYNEGLVDDIEAKALTVWWQQQVPFKKQLEYTLINQMIEFSPDIVLPYSKIEIADMLNGEDLDLSNFFENVVAGQDDNGIKTLNIKMQEAQYNIIMEAIDKVKAIDKCNDAQAIERICADYLAGV